MSVSFNPMRPWFRRLGPRRASANFSAQVVQRQVVQGTLFLLCFGTFRIYLQQRNMIGTAVGTAWYALVVWFYLVASALREAGIVRREMAARSATEARLQCAIAAHNESLESLERERNWLACIFTASLSYSVIATDKNGLITHFNEGAEHMLGYSAQDMVYTHSMLHLHDPQELADRVKVLGVIEPFDVFRVLPNLNLCDEREWTYVRCEGQRLPVRLSVTRIYNAQGETLGYMGIARDLTEDKNNQRDRDGYLSVGQELLCIADTQSIMHTINPAFFRVLGWLPEDVVGKRYLDFVHPDDLPNTQGILTDVTQGSPTSFREPLASQRPQLALDLLGHHRARCPRHVLL